MMNTAMLLGRVGQKDFKVLKNGGELTVLSIATNKKWKDASGTSQELTTWHNVNCFSKLSDIANKYVNIGDLILIRGEIQNRKIESGERAGQYIYSIHADDIRLIPKGSANKQSTSPNKSEDNKKNEENIDDDDIPF